ncbi:MAG: hypothetical protein HZA36_01310 [Parcubacteria group bacterium]|nr:hypothetical protein [Parcubacteria group bacterium]
MSQIFITKANGEREFFSEEKIKHTAMRAGASEELASKVAREVGDRIYEGISTRSILRLIRESLDVHEPVVAHRYGLKEAILKLGPTGFDFEQYLVHIFSAYGYKAELPPILEGMCVTHEVDLLIEKENRRGMVEAKLHHDPVYVGIKDTMAIWTRYLDLVDGSRLGKTPHLDEVWIVTNGKFSTDSLKFGHCKNMILLGWNHPKERPISKWIEDEHLYPVTIMSSLSADEQKRMISANIFLVSQLVTYKPKQLGDLLGIEESRIVNLMKIAEGLLK